MDTSEGLVVPNVKQVQVGNDAIGMSLIGFFNVFACIRLFELVCMYVYIVYYASEIMGADTESKI